ncbi:hypothetical protein M8818_000504 [Zalaria obscura]|uniref:Uncharacterized protein n=1 Tax=Zalaria obscura TaxID=2024903 RepID=A0ACC3SN24_9PEZI
MDKGSCMLPKGNLRIFSIHRLEALRPATGKAPFTAIMAVPFQPLAPRDSTGPCSYKVWQESKPKFFVPPTTILGVDTISASTNYATTGQDFQSKTTQPNKMYATTSAPANTFSQPFHGCGVVMFSQPFHGCGVVMFSQPFHGCGVVMFSQPFHGCGVVMKNNTL